MLEILITTKILPVGILQKSLHHRLVTLVVGILQIMQSYHQSDWKPRTTKILHIESAKLLFKDRPVNLVSQSVKRWSRFKICSSSAPNRSPCLPDSSPLLGRIIHQLSEMNFNFPVIMQYRFTKRNTSWLDKNTFSGTTN